MKSGTILKRKEKRFSSGQTFSTIELKRAKYTLKVLMSEISKFLILLALSSFAGKTAEFLASTFILLLVRSFSGGLHFSSYGRCLAFSVIFYSLIIYFPSGPLEYFRVPILLWSLIAICLYSPVQSDSRPRYSHASLTHFRSAGILALISITLGLVLFPGPMDSVILSTLFFQSTQIIIAKEVNEHGNKKNRKQGTDRIGVFARDAGPDVNIVNK